MDVDDRVLRSVKRKIEETNICRLCDNTVAAACSHCQISYCRYHAARHLYWGKGENQLPWSPLCKLCMVNIQKKINSGIALLNSFDEAEINEAMQDLLGS